MLGSSAKFCSGSAAQIQPLFATEYFSGSVVERRVKYGSTSGLLRERSLSQYRELERR